MGRWNGQSSRGFGNRQRSHGQTWRRRSKQGPTLYWRAYHATHGEFNPHAKQWLILLVLIVSIAGLALFQYGPASVQSLSSLIHDPLKPLWTETLAGGAGELGLSGSGKVIQCIGSYVAGVPQFGYTNGLIVDSTQSQAVFMSSNTTNTAFCINQTPMDLSTASAKLLDINSVFGWGVNSATKFPTRIGLYLTRNATLPTQLQATYSPTTDLNTALAIIGFVNKGGANTMQTVVYIQRDVTRSLASDDHGCPNVAGSVFICSNINTLAAPPWALDTVLPANGGKLYNLAAPLTLNYTGNTGSPSASSLLCCDDQTHGLSTTAYTLPPFNFQSQKYYLGLWEDVCSTGPQCNELDWQASYSPDFIGKQATPYTSIIGGMEVDQYTPPTLTPTIDSGGFFGPILHALGSALVTAGAVILQFLNSLFNSPQFAAAIAFLSGTIITIVNAIGGLFGMNTLGTQLAGFVGDFASFITNSFRGMTGIVSNIVTLINNIVTFITNFVTTNNFTNLLYGFVGSLGNVWTVINGVWADLAKWFIAGSITTAAIFQIDWAIGTLWTAIEGTKGFKDWLDINELFVVNLFKIAYWLFELGLDVIFKIIMIIKGRVAPIEVLGTG